MARPNPIRRIMEANLPSITYQRRKQFRPGPAEVTYAYNIINRHVFRGQLQRPNIRTGRLGQAWGVCSWHDHEQLSGSSCDIWIADKWYCPQWFMNTLAHEMVHQWQWDVYRWDHIEQHGRDIYQKSGGHGPSFYAWRDEFKYYGLDLKIFFRQKKWFKYQDFSKC
jgi:SprT-like family